MTLASAGRHDLVLVQATLALGGLDLEVVAHAGLLLHDLAAAGDLEALLGTRSGSSASASLFLLGSAATRVADGCAGLGLGGSAVCVSGSPAHPPPAGPSPQHAVRSPRPWPRTCSSAGAMTMTMLRPSIVGLDSTVPNSATSSAKRCSRRTPCSGRDCSRPRNRIIALTLSPAFRKPSARFAWSRSRACRS